MKNTLCRVYNGVVTVLIFCVVLLAILLVGVRLVGLSPYAVLSGSMEPAYPVGSLLYVQEADPQTLQVNDPVTYRMPDGGIVTHRIIEVVEEGKQFRTKGDANEMDDGILDAGRIIGKPVFMIPLLGFVSFFVQNPPGSYVTIAACALLFMLSVLAPKPKKKESPANEAV